MCRNCGFKHKQHQTAAHVLDQRFSTWGTRTPRGTWGGYRGYAKSPQGYAKFKKPHPIEAFLGRIFYLGVREGDGGTQRGTILIWGYASTKRLRTPALDHDFFPEPVIHLFTTCARLRGGTDVVIWNIVTLLT